MTKKKKKRNGTGKRIGASVSRWLKRQNPGGFKKARTVRVRKLKGGGITVIPV
jgi:hypothetical protein